MTTGQAVWSQVQSQIRGDGGDLIQLKWIDRRGVACEMVTDPHTATQMKIEIKTNCGTLISESA